MTYRAEFISRGMEAIAQIGVLDMWERHRVDAPLPTFKDFKFFKVGSVLDHVMFCDVKYSETVPEFIIHFHGDGFTRTYGRKCFGRNLGDVLPEAIRQQTLADYRRVALTRRPAFSSRRLTGDNTNVLLYQRLLLPFTVWGKNTDRIVCVLNLKPTTGKRVVEAGLLHANEEN
jgi:hypothetical protein